MNLTSITRGLLSHRLKQMQTAMANVEVTQTRVMQQLITKAANTEWGTAHGFSNIHSYQQFAAAMPVSQYDNLAPWIQRMRQGEPNILWPGRVRCYAKSSGTTSSRSKFIPVSADALRDTHYRGGTDTVAWYLHHHPQSRLIDGKALILGGSRDEALSDAHQMTGDLSAILIQNTNPLVNWLRATSRQTALMADFEQKRLSIAREVMHRDVTNLSGVPSWMMSVLQCVLQLSGKDSLLDVWPHLEVFFHGGVAFGPYRKQYNQMLPSDSMHYMETYNASEGFFALQDCPGERGMSLMTDYGVFYEFIPMDQLSGDSPSAVPLWGVETGRNYAMLITTSSGLWRYMIGDTVQFTSTNPYRIVITGRTQSYINAFGEELMVGNADTAIERTCSQTGATVLEYTAAPVFMDSDVKCSHQWLIEFDSMPDNLDHFTTLLDSELRTLNSDYDAKRHHDVTLQMPTITVARRNLFHDWLQENGKLGGQHKVPRLSNQRLIIDSMLKMNTPLT